MDGRAFLLQELTSRKNRNAAYSLRAFARDLSVSPAALSQYLGRKREFSRKNLTSVIEQLRLSPAEQKILRDHDKGAKAISRELISEDLFHAISDWVSLAILNLAALIDNRASPRWIGARLGISLDEARISLERLERLKLIRVRAGRLQRTGRAFATSQDVPSAAIKRFHLSILDKARESLLKVPVEERDITAIVMPTDPKKLAKAKQIVRRMRHRIADLVSTSAAEEVYVLAVQLFPLTLNEEK